MSFRMVSEYGNAIYYVKTERERDEFLRKGYREEKPQEKSAVKKNEGAKAPTKKNSSTKRGTKNEKNQN